MTVCQFSLPRDRRQARLRVACAVTNPKIIVVEKHTSYLKFWIPTISADKFTATITLVTGLSAVLPLNLRQWHTVACYSVLVQVEELEIYKICPGSISDVTNGNFNNN